MHTDRASVAILMSNYNHARYLGESLGGIASQTRPADEIVIVDDGSTDGSAELIARFAEGNPAVRFLRNPQRLGVHASVARAMLLVKSDYLVWTAADDRLLPEFLEKSMKVLARYPQAGLCFSETAQLQGDSGVVVRFATEAHLRHIFDLCDLPEFLTPPDMIRRMKRAYLPIAANTVVVRRDALLSLHGFYRELEWHADSFAYTAIAIRYGACVVAETLAVIRATPGSYSHAMYDPAKESPVLATMLDLLASKEYRDIRRVFRLCPSNFSPGWTLMLRVQLRKVRDWDLFVSYFLWKVREYKRVHRLSWAGMFVHALLRLPLALRNRQLEAQLQAERAAHAAEKAELQARLQEMEARLEKKKGAPERREAGT